MKQYTEIDDTVYFWFAGNDTSGSGGDGASPAADVRLAGAVVDAIPTYSPTPTLLTHANYPAGAYEVAITASAANGFAADNTYAVFCTLAIDSQNPTGFIGSFDTKPALATMTDWENGERLDLILDIVAADTTTDIPALINALNDLSATQVNAEVADVIRVDTVSEMAQGAPPATPTPEQMLAYLYFMVRNKNEETATEHAVYNDAGTTKLFKAEMSDDSTTLTKAEYVSGA